MAPLCREFGISKKTGYKIWNRYKELGSEALIEKKRTPYRYANKLPVQIELLILDQKKNIQTGVLPKLERKLKDGTLI